MRGFRFSPFFFLLALLFSTPAAARVEDGTLIDPAVIAPLMAWVAQETGVTPPVMPQVIASRTRLAEALKGDNDSPAGRPRAGYLPGIVIVDNLLWDEEDSTQLSLIVHELVHHTQKFQKNAAWNCPDAREYSAYTLQNKWLESQGHSSFVDANWVQQVSTCAPQPGSIINADAASPES